LAGDSTGRKAAIAYRIELEKENFKFSASHFTIFGKGHAERLHGHNYYASCEILLDRLDPELGLAFDFNLVKPMIREITEWLDEYVLVPERSPHLEVQTIEAKTGSKVRVQFGTKEYLFPAEDTRLLPLVNITSEELARYIAEQLIERLRPHTNAARLIREIHIGVQETRGQTVYYQTSLGI
jgi:6-pyruvoyltetrahydropterin/6-carboxytetrahydropterin synthase